MPIRFATRFNFSGPNPIEVVVVQDSVTGGDRVGLSLQVALSYGSPLWAWTVGGYTAEGWVERTWPELEGPWDSLAYWGPQAQAAATQLRKFCPMCGSPRALGARFCQQCGSPLEGASGQGGEDDLKAQVLQAASSGPAVTSLVLELANAYLVPQFHEPGRSLLASKLAELLSQAAEISFWFTDGESADPGEAALCLASAQGVASKVGQRVPMTLAELEEAKVLLRQGPFKYGYWGPIKSLLKGFDASRAPEEFGTALGRLSRAAAAGGVSHSPLPPDMEDLSWLWSMVNLPSKATLHYMERRMRRWLSDLGAANPGLYAQVSTHMLLAWDHSVGASSFLPAYVLQGSRKVLNWNSRAVALPFDQAEPLYAHPSAWAANLDLIRLIVANVEHSPELLTFALQVLRANGQPIPGFTSTTLPLALRSTEAQTVGDACEALPTLQSAWDSLPEDAWVTFFTEAQPAALTAACGALLARAPKSSVASASSRALLVVEDADLARLLPIAQVYLAYNSELTSWLTPAAAARAIEIVASQLDFSVDPRTWQALLSGFEMPILVEALLKVARRDGVSSGTLDVLRNLVLTACTEASSVGYFNYIGYPSHGWDAVFHAARLCLASPSSLAADLGWKLIDLCTKPDNDYPSWLGGSAAATAEVEKRLWTWLRDDYENAAEIEEWRSGRLVLIHELLSRSASPSDRLAELLSDPAWQFTADELMQLLSIDSASAVLAWNALGGDEAAGLHEAALGNPALLAVIGNAVPPDAVAQSSASQVAALVAYVNANPERIQRDPRFGVALASMPEPQLQDIALAQLVASGALAEWWIPLAECGLPRPLAVAREYITSISDRARFTDAVLAAVDSGVAVVRDMGLDFLDQDDSRLDPERTWEALLHSDDARVQARVAEESLVRNWANDSSLADFDRRLLVTRRRNRKAKELVKTRLEGMPADETSGEQLSIAPQRIDALLDMAQGANSRDREWALRRIAILSLNGIDVAGADVSLVTPGGSDDQL
jgi:hypothetical protein